MKGVFVFNQINDIVFINTDESYKRHISLQAAESGLIQKEAIDDPLDSNVVLQLFSPLIASQRFMIGQLHDPYTTIKGGDQYLMVFKQFSGYVFLAVCGDGQETEQFLHHKLCILHRIITFLHGPCLQEIRPDKQRERNVRWRLIGQMMTTWCDLYQSQQSFLVEALERLHVNDKVNRTCVELLEAALNGMKASGEKQAVHAMLIAQTKLLALFSSRSATDLSGGDQLMFILLANMLFKDAKMTGSQQHLNRLSSRETLKPTMSIHGPVKIGKHLDRENSNTPLLDGSGSNSSESEINSESDDFVLDFSTDNKESGESSDSVGTKLQASLPVPLNKPTSEVPNPLQTTLQNQSTRVTTDSPKPQKKVTNPLMNYPLLSEESSSSSTTVSKRKPLTKSDDEESSLDVLEGNVRMSSSLPPISIVSNKNWIEKSNLSRNSRQGNESSNNGSSSSDDNSTIKPQSQSHNSDPHHRLFSSQSTVTGGHNIPSLDAIHRPTPPPSSSQRHTVNVPDASLLNSDVKKETAQNTSKKAPSVNQDNFADYHKLTAMLRQGDVQNVPHCIHTVLVIDGIYLVIVCEVARVTHARTITQSLEACSYLLDALDYDQGKYSTTKQAYDVFDSHVKKLGEILKKSKGVPQVERIIVDIGQKWDIAKQAELLKHVDGRYSNIQGQTRSNTLNRLEGCLSTILDKLQDLFNVLYLMKRNMPSDLHQSIINGVETIQGTMRRCLSDYKDYINIMAHRNMPMTIYVDEFPGMVHFIFINRSSNVMVAPSFHENLHQEEDHSHQTSKLVKEKVWRMFEWFQQGLASGTTSMTSREGDFHYSYFIWFEDTQGGFPVVPPVPVGATSVPHSNAPGMISTPYYTGLQRQCFPNQDKKNVCCYELMCVHVSLVPTQLALGHCRKLKDKLWKVSVDTNSPISLL